MVNVPICGDGIAERRDGAGAVVKDEARQVRNAHPAIFASNDDAVKRTIAASIVVLKVLYLPAKDLSVKMELGQRLHRLLGLFCLWIGVL